ncbi:MAG TPA: carboxypeptidase-like regulatory domain-containing protein, partial [Candidatus Baltobacteraceae bacterium]|nr:carboxypeptidase-like regulatory domain-containing protein [Candidatus Baltobacteraceae bacterium]
LADVNVVASAPSQTAKGTTDAHGFFALFALGADTYTVTFSRNGYLTVSDPGVVVFQDQTSTVNERLQPALKTIAETRSAPTSSLVRANQGTDVYTVSGAQLSAATNPGDTLTTLYQYTAVVPGVTGTGFPGQPRVHGGQVTDLGYEFEGIPIEDRSVGFYTTTLNNIGVANLEVYTGGLSAANAANGTGFLNSVLKVGTNPGFVQLTQDIGSPSFNHMLSFQTGYATPDRRYSYYVGYSGANEMTNYDYGTYPGVLFWGGTGPGPIAIRDWVGNFHYRPNPKDDFQFVVTNGYGYFNFDYLINQQSGEPPALQFEPCPGAVPVGNYGKHNPSGTPTAATGGTAPNGQPCPVGLFWGALPTAQGNTWYQYAALGKLQWNHTIDNHSFYSLRFAENYGAYIFDQTIGDANIPGLENPGKPWNWARTIGLPGNACPRYPYAAGSPVVEPKGDPYDLCAFDDGVQNFWGERRSNMYFGTLDYQNVLSDAITVKAGVTDEVDQNIFNYQLTNQYNYTSGNPYTNNGTWPAIYENSTYPTNRQQVFADSAFHVGKFLLTPGLLWAQQHYAFPDGGQTVSILNPTFNGTYAFSPKDVMRFSWGDTASFIGSAYVYTSPNSLITRNPKEPGTSFAPQLNHNFDIQWEHQFDSETSLRVGPWVSKTTNYYETYQPVVGHTSTGLPIFSKTSVLSNNQQHQDFGIEFALNRLDHHPIGVSYWLTATYDNYWTTASALAGAYINEPLPQNIVDQGTLIRATANPLWSTSFLLDLHSGGFHVDPLIVYQTGYYFNVGDVHSCVPASVPDYGCGYSSYGGKQVAPYIASPEQIAGAFWVTNLQVYDEIGPHRNFLVGVKVNNLFDNTNDVTPCFSTTTGCAPYFNGPYSGVKHAPNNGYIYQNYAENPYIGALSVDSMQRMIEVYFGFKL